MNCKYDLFARKIFLKFQKGVWGECSLFDDSRADTPLTCPLLVRIRNGKGMYAYLEVVGVTKTESSVPNLNISTDLG